MERMITRKEAAAFLGISIATLDAARINGQISYVQYVPNGCIYFTSTSLQEYIAKCTHRARPADKSLTYRMYAVETLKKNITDLFSTLAFVFDEDADDVIDFICDMDFPEIYQGIRKRALPIFRHATGAFDQDQPMYISEKLLPLEGTLICRDINRAYDIDENYTCRRYLELWVLEDMSLRFISNFTTIYNDGTHYTEYRQDQGSDFPNEEYWLDLEDVFEALISFWKQDAKDNLNIFYES